MKITCETCRFQSSYEKFPNHVDCNILHLPMPRGACCNRHPDFATLVKDHEAMEAIRREDVTEIVNRAGLFYVIGKQFIRFTNMDPALAILAAAKAKEEK